MKRFTLVLILSTLVSNIALAQQTCINSSGYPDSPTCTNDQLDVNIAGVGTSVADPVDVANVGQRARLSTVLTVTAGAYSVNDVIGGEQTVAIGRAGILSGVIEAVSIADFAAQGKNLDVVFFKTNPASDIADNDPFAPSDADVRQIIGVCHITEHTAWTTNGISQNQDCNIPFDNAATAVYYYVVAVEAPTYAGTDDLTVNLLIAQD